MTRLGPPLHCLIDGAPNEALPVTDRGLSYGDGLFETLWVRAGRPCQWGRHWARLVRGCLRLGLSPPQESILADEVGRLLQGACSGVLKILVTRGDGGRGYAPPPAPSPRRILVLYPVPDYPTDWSATGVVVRLCQTPATQNPALAGLKHLNRLDSVLARSEWSDPGIAEGLMAGPEGEMVGGTMTNLFLWDGSTLRTPVIDRCGIAGTVRDLTLELAAGLGIACVETPMGAADLLSARGIFLTNSLIGAWPVRQLGGRDLDPGALPLELVATIQRRSQTPDEGCP